MTEQELLILERQAGNLKKQHHCYELYSLFHSYTNVITLIYWYMERSSTFSMEEKQFMSMLKVKAQNPSKIQISIHSL